MLAVIAVYALAHQAGWLPTDTGDPTSTVLAHQDPKGSSGSGEPTGSRSARETLSPEDLADPDRQDDADLIAQLFESSSSDVMVETLGEVERVLTDDTKGSKHQRFIVRLANEHSLLISHNIDLAPRVPLERGDLVAFRREYEWNSQGGVVHWTHHDPGRRRVGGWIEHDGRRYR